MSELKDFRSKDFVQQVKLISEVEKNKSREAIPELVEMLKDPLPDVAVQNMAEDVLRLLLSENEDEVVKMISSENNNVKIFSIKVD